MDSQRVGLSRFLSTHGDRQGVDI